METKDEQFGVDVCLAAPPFHPLHFPALGLSMLSRACQTRGLSTKVVYGGMPLAARTGFTAYDHICGANKAPMLGDRLFRAHAYPPETLARLPEPRPLPEDAQAKYDRVAFAIAPALEAFVDEVLALRPRILGISSTFDQNLACAALARQVKMRAPDICVVMGGPNVAWPMSRGLAEIFPWIDYFFAGESDIDFPNFCERLIRHGETPADRIIRSEPIRDMAVVSTPDFSDFFAALRPLQAAGSLPDWLPRYVTMEGSRGCWWGAKHHCTFCGLNADGMGFREKSPDRMKAELAEIAEWGVNLFWMTDNIMPLRYMTDVWPALAEHGPHVQFFYEVKANLTEQQIDVMARGGVTSIQPGIESLSSHVLELMRKGVSAHQNIALLRSCAGVGVWVIWNILYGFPGETAEDYESTIALLPRIAHLQPATGAHKIVIDRFSPYFNESEALGIGPVQPFGSYRALYPPEAALNDIAYHFYSDDYSTDLLARPELLERLQAAIATWQRGWKAGPHPVLQLFEKDGTTCVLDTRPIARELVTVLSADQESALRHFERPRARATLDPTLERVADWLIARDFVLDHEGKLVSVVVRPRPEIANVVAALGATATSGNRPSQNPADVRPMASVPAR